jgi:hypothetical protein
LPRNIPTPLAVLAITLVGSIIWRPDNEAQRLAYPRARYFYIRAERVDYVNGTT